MSSLFVSDAADPGSHLAGNMFVPIDALKPILADLKDHVAEHGFHVHDERHFIETYTNRQTWEIDLHPDRACDGPLDMHMALEVDPRTLIAFEDEVMRVGEEGEPDESITIPVTISFALPPLPAGPAEQRPHRRCALRT